MRVVRIVAHMSTATVAIAALLTMGPTSGTAQTPLELLDDHTAGEVVGINNRGDVAGSSFSEDPLSPAFAAVIWDRNGQPTELERLPQHDGAVALGINNRGDAIGLSSVFAPLLGGIPDPCDASVTLGVVWNKKGVATPIQPLDDGDFAIPDAINDSGVMVGLSVADFCSGSTTEKPVIWDRRGRPRLLAQPAGGSATPEDVNNRGDVVGNAPDVVVNGVATPRGVLWKRGGQPELLDPPDDHIASFAFAINNGGLIAGASFGDTQDGDETSFAVVWDNKGNPKMLEIPDGYVAAAAFDINDGGRVVGYAGSDPSLSDPIALVVWDKKGNPTIVDQDIGTRDSDVSINNRGDIALTVGGLPMVLR